MNDFWSDLKDAAIIYTCWLWGPPVMLWLALRDTIQGFIIYEREFKAAMAIHEQCVDRERIREVQALIDGSDQPRS